MVWNLFLPNIMFNLEAKYSERRFGVGEKEEVFGLIIPENTPYGITITWLQCLKGYPENKPTERTLCGCKIPKKIHYPKKLITNTTFYISELRMVSYLTTRKINR